MGHKFTKVSMFHLDLENTSVIQAQIGKDVPGQEIAEEKANQQQKVGEEDGGHKID